MRTTTLALLLLLALPVTACTSISEEDTESSSSELSAKLSPAELASTKAQLRAITNANMTRTDNRASVRAQVDPLVDKLAKHFGKRAATAKVPLVEGAWRQLWSDYPFVMTSFISMDATQVYQVVTADGHYWNIGDQKAIGIFGLTGVLRGKYRPSGTKLEIEFTNVGFRFGRLGKNENMVDLADGLESGDRFYLGLPGGGEAPNGPVGIRGTLETLYVDGDLRVERGTQDDFLDDAGKVLVPGYGPKLFILDRVTTPVK